MTIEEVKKHFESIGIKEGDELMSALWTDVILPSGWRYSDFEIHNGISSIDLIGRWKEDLDVSQYVWLYDSETDSFATPIK